MTTIPIYTCVSGGYESQLFQPAPQSRDVQFICFTDGNLQSAEGWQTYPLAAPPEIRRPDHISRYHKLVAHRLFPAARFSIWVDANLAIVGDLMPLVAQLEAAGSALGAARHRRVKNFEQEIELCYTHLKFKGDDGWRVERQRRFYRSQQVPGGRHWNSCILVRDHASPLLAPAMELWWQQLTRFTARDQISLPYVVAATGLPMTTFDVPIMGPNGYTRRYEHGRQDADAPRPTRRTWKTLRRMLSYVMRRWPF